jgi:hypothetical protein
MSTNHWPTRLALSLWVLSLALTMGSFAMALLVASVDMDWTWTPGVFLFPGQLAWSTVGALITRRHPTQPIGWLFCTYGVAMGIALFADPYGRYAFLAPSSPLPAGGLMLWLAPKGGALALTCATFALLLFPTGRLPSRRWRPVAWLVIGAYALSAAAEAVHPGQQTNGVPFDNPLGIPTAAALIGLLATVAVWLEVVGLAASGSSLFVRLWRARGAERQQLKWITSAAALLAAVFSVGITLEAIKPRPPIADLFLDFFVFCLGLIPLAAGVAILRYRLYDIDILIRRTLIYGALSAGLGLAYWAAIVLLQQVLRPFVQGSELAVIGSTLAVAGLFSPARRRIQSLVDRRFYRRKYDAQRTLESFSVQLRQEVDLDSLTAELIRVARDAMQPAHAGLWLKPALRPRGQDSAR